ncbi:MAG TPA: ATP-binding protein [Gemmatimonas sp.]|uniref:sensor histidine kinase n=1 Tax=Gemmatimonas sp. TaxID=1962908 RepID=UPI002EDB5DBF
MTANALASSAIFGLVRRLAVATPGPDGIREILAGTGEALSADRVSFEPLAPGMSPVVWWAKGVAEVPFPAWQCTVRTGEGVLGTLVVHRERPMSDDDETLLNGTCDLLGVAVSRDVHQRELERQISERIRELADQRAFMECIVDSLPTGLYVVDREYRIHAWNHKRETGLQGVSRTDAVGRSIFDVLHRQPAAMLKREFDEVFSSGRLQQFQMESNAYGDTRTFRISKIPMRMGGAERPVTHVITIGEDITDWKAAIDRTAQAEKLAALGQLAAGVMHEINNPLATIAACAESMSLQQELGPGAAPPTELLRIIDLEVQRCKKIVNGLLDFSRPKTAGRERVDLNTVVQQGLFLLQHHPRFKRVKLVTELEERSPMIVDADTDQLVQVLIALAMNALDATPEGGRVTIRTRPLPSGTDTHPELGAAFEVADEGPGIPRALQAKVFEPFFTTKPPGQGTGLGLAICYGIVRDHGGALELVSPEGTGAVFRVALPVAMTVQS